MSQDRNAIAKAVDPTSFATGQSVVHPSHGVGTVSAVQKQTVAGFDLEVLVLAFPAQKANVLVPLKKAGSVGLRPVASEEVIAAGLRTLGERPKAFRGVWSRRAADTTAKIATGSLPALAEVMRDMYRPETDQESSYSQRVLYETARDRFAGELSAARGLTPAQSAQVLQAAMWTSPASSRKGAPAIEEAEAEAA